MDHAALFDASPNPYMVVDRELRYLAANRAYADAVGVRVEQLIGHGLFEIFPGQDEADGESQARRVRASIERVFRSGQADVLALIPYSIERETDAGAVVEMRYWSATHTPIRDASGAVHAVLQHTTDVTDLRAMRSANSTEQVEEALLSRARAVRDENLYLAAQRRQLMSLFAQAPGFMAVMRGPDYVYEIANSAYERLVGRSDLVGHSARLLLPELEEQGYFELLDQVRRSGEAFVGRAMEATIRAPGEAPRQLFVDFVFQPLSECDGRVDAIFIQGSDVTQREHATQALRESESRLRTITDMIPQMVWSTDAAGLPDYYNRQWYEFTGVPEGATDGAAWITVFHPDDRERARATWQHCVDTGEPYEIEYRMRHHSGEYRWTLGRGLPIRDAHGGVRRWMGTCTDIHSHKTAQAALERSEAALRETDRRKDQFLAMLAHELRNPLAPIRTGAKLLQLAGDDPQSVRRASEIIERQVGHMTHLVNDLLDVSRVTRGLTALNRVRLDLRDAIRDALEQAANLFERRQHRLELRLPEAEVVVEGDAPRLIQIFSNLLANAAKYTPSGGEVRLELRRDTDWAEVEVIDNGIGMDAGFLAQAFELFTQADATPEHTQGGLGVGLALVRRLVELHAGTIEASSAGHGQGSRFRVRLPLAAQDTPAR